MTLFCVCALPEKGRQEVETTGGIAGQITKEVGVWCGAEDAMAPCSLSHFLHYVEKSEGGRTQ